MSSTATGVATAAEIVGDASLAGRVFFITGGNSGIGKESARVLYNAGATVIIASRSPTRLEEAIESLRDARPPTAHEGGILHGLVLDLSKLSSVRLCVESFRELGIPTIDTLICNAGVADMPYGLSEDGFEMTFAINHYGHFFLTMLLLPFITRRIVVVSSAGHFRSNFTVDQLPTLDPETFNGLTVYGDTKLANILFAKEFQKQLLRRSSPIRVYSLHPGTVQTGIGRQSERAQKVLDVYAHKSIPEGAATTVYAALAETIGHGLGGEYLQDCQIAMPSDSASDAVFARRLFAHTEEATKIRFCDVKLHGEAE